MTSREQVDPNYVDDATFARWQRERREAIRRDRDRRRRTVAEPPSEPETISLALVEKIIDLADGLLEERNLLRLRVEQLEEQLREVAA